MAKIIIRINSNTGETKISAEGYQGPVCKEKTRPFEERLGITSGDTETAEMYNEQTTDQTENQH